MDELKRQIIQKGVTQLLDEAKVPQRIHLQVVQALSERIKEHKNDLAAHQEILKQHESYLKDHERQMKEWDTLQQHLQSLEKIQGAPGKDADENRITEEVFRRIRIPKDGKDADENRIRDAVLSLIPNPEPGEPGKDADPIDEDVLFDKFLKKIQKEKLLDTSHIKGAQKFIKDGISYKFEELMHGSGSKAASTGLVFLTATGTVDNTNKVFTFVSSPTIVSVNGSSYINGSGVTIVGTTATLDNAPGVGGLVFGLG